MEQDGPYDLFLAKGRLSALLPLTYWQSKSQRYLCAQAYLHDTTLASYEHKADWPYKAS